MDYLPIVGVLLVFLTVVALFDLGVVAYRKWRE